MPSNSLSFSMPGHGVLQFTRPDAALIASLETQPLPKQIIVFEDLALNAPVGSLVKVQGNALLQAQPEGTGVESIVGVPVRFAADAHALLLRLGIEGQAAVSGQIALAPAASVQFGIKAKGRSHCSVVRVFPDKVLTGAAELASLIGRWKLPAAISDVADLPPGATLVADLDGSIKASLGITYGLKYNWVRAAKGAGLSGDVGLKLELGASAALGLELSGSFLVVISRPSLDAADQKVRITIHKRSSRGLDLPLHAGTTVQADLSKLLPDRADDFLRAIFGVTGQQILNDLAAIDRWTGGDESLGGILAELGSTHAKQLLHALTGIDPETEFNKAKSTALVFLNHWGQLKDSVGPLLLKLLDQNVNVAALRSTAEQVLSGNVAGLTDAIRTGDPSVLVLLESISGKSVLALLNSGPVLATAQPIAGAVLKVLDGSVLTRLQDFVSDRLALTPVIAGLQQAQFAGLDRLLQVKLASFLDKAVAEVTEADLEIIRKAAHLFLSKRQEFYAKALEIAQRTYSAELSALYERGDDSSSLIDLTLDFADGATADQLRAVIRGDFTELVSHTHAGVTVHEAAITHGLKRHTHQEIHLPHYIRISDHLNQANASFHVADNSGSVLVSALGSDTVEEIGKLHNRRTSTLSVAARFPGRLDRIAVFDSEGLGCSYRLDQDFTNPREWERNLRNYAAAFFPASTLPLLPGSSSGPAELALEVSVPASIASAWFHAVSDEEIAHRQLSRAIQVSMRRIVPFFYVQDEANRHLSDATAPLLLYAALPPISRSGDQYFDFEDPRARKQLIETQQTGSHLTALIKAGVVPGATLGNIPASIHSTIGAADFHALLFTEAEMIAGALQARRELVGLAANIAHERAAAMLHLSHFLSTLTDTFHKRVSSIYGGGALRPLGTLVFLQTCFALMPDPPSYADVLLPSLLPVSNTMQGHEGLKARLELTAGTANFHMTRGY